MNELRKRFEHDYLVTKQSCTKPYVLVTAVMLPNGAVEVATNTSEIEAKMEYINNAYDESFRLKTNPMIKVIGYMLA